MMAIFEFWIFFTRRFRFGELWEKQLNANYYFYDFFNGDVSRFIIKFILILDAHFLFLQLVYEMLN